MATSKNFEVKNGLSVAGTERISSAGAFSGSIASATTGTTQSASDNSTKIATTAYTDAAITALVDSSPSTLNTLNELAAALNDDASFSTTVTNSIATKLPLAGGTMTGNLVVSTGSPQIQLQTGASHYNWQIAAQEAVNTAFEISSGAQDADATNDTYTPRLVILQSGNVGIGTNTPSQKLDVNGTVELNNLTVGGAQGSDGQVLTSTGSGVAWEDAAGGGVTGISSSADATALTISSSENIGFNTTDVTVGSSVSGNSTATPKFITYNNDYSSGYTDASLKLYLFNQGTTRQGFTSGPAYDLQYHSSGSDAGRHAFHVANTEIMRINKTQVGIGDSSVINSNTTSTLAVRKDNSGGRGGEISIVNYAATAVGNEAALNFGLENSTYDNNNGNFQIKAYVTGSNAATDAIFSQWSGSAFKQRMRLKSNGTFYISEDLGAHTGVYSFDHNTYQHAAVFGANSTPNGSVVIEDYDVSSGIGNTVLRCYLRDQDPATNAVFIDFSDGGGRVGSVTHNDDGGGVSYNTTSDYRLKENVDYTWDALPLLNQLKPAKFNFKRNPAKTIQGMLAHEVMDIVPSSVRGDKDHMQPIGTIRDSDGNNVYEGVYEHFTKTDEGQTWEQTGTEPLYQELDYSRLVPLLTKALQEADDKIDALEARITTLEG